ncbi:NAD(P)-binding domain-containing protein [candidate division KSB1 bacterium]|nr:NAD(P)-binding domain-containing protein [candidate division KSB1 bacterium]
MKIAIIGSGNVGGALARGLAKAGHQILLAVRNLEDEKVKRLLHQHKNISAHQVSDAVAAAEVVIVATPVTAVTFIAKSLGDVKDKVIIDATNAVFVKSEPYQNGVAALLDLTNSKHVVKCFNSTGFENMENPIYHGMGIDMFVAGDSVKGKEVACQLAKDLGFAECYDFGGTDKVNLLEQFALAWINLAIMQKQGRDIAFKILRRDN